MRVLLNENVGRRLKRLFVEQHEVITVPERGWTRTTNGELLEAAQKEFDVFVSTDRGIPHQQNIPRFDLAVVILEAKSNSYEDLVSLTDRANSALADLTPGEAVQIHE